MIMMVIIMIMVVITVMIKMKIDDDKRYFFLKGGDHLHSQKNCLCKFQLLTSKKQKRLIMKDRLSQTIYVHCHRHTTVM